MKKLLLNLLRPIVLHILKEGNKTDIVIDGTIASTRDQFAFDTKLKNWSLQGDGTYARKES